MKTYTEKQIGIIIIVTIILTFVFSYFTFYFIILENAKMYFVCECYDKIVYNMTVPAKIFR